MQEFAQYSEIDPDVRLMLAVQLDDTTAFDELVARYESRLISVLALLIGDREQARDLSKRCFCVCFELARHTSQRPGSVRGCSQSRTMLLATLGVGAAFPIS